MAGREDGGTVFERHTNDLGAEVGGDAQFVGDSGDLQVVR